MMKRYTYTPNQTALFQCRVPIRNSSQLLVTDGIAGEIVPAHQGAGKTVAKIERGKEGMGYALLYESQAADDNFLQIISIRNNREVMDCTNTITLREAARAKVLLCFHTVAQGRVETGEKLNIELGDKAVLDLVVMQNEHDKSVHDTNFNITLNNGSYLNLHIITLHGGEISNNLSINLNGKHGDCRLNGLYLASGNQLISNNINIYHNVGECHSNQLFKGILGGNAVTNFSGTIYVRENAQKSEAYQANNNLLSSENAIAHTQPHLEIYADDVKCSHGATIGSLNEDELFYMRSRGISIDEGRILQQLAFANAVLEGINNAELRDRLAKMTEGRLRGEFTSCHNCDTRCC